MVESVVFVAFRGISILLIFELFVVGSCSSTSVRRHNPLILSTFLSAKKRNGIVCAFAGRRSAPSPSVLKPVHNTVDKLVIPLGRLFIKAEKLTCNFIRTNIPAKNRPLFVTLKEFTMLKQIHLIPVLRQQ